MLGLRFSRLPKHRRYSYTPVYYNEEKEKLDAQVERIKREMGQIKSDEQSAKENIRRAFNTTERKERYAKAPLQKFYSLRIVMIASILGLIFLKLLNSDSLGTIFEAISR